MTTLQIVASAIFLLAYVFIALEHNVKLSKSSIALIAGTLLWILVPLSKPENMTEHITQAGADVFSVVIFLLAAMSLVEVLAHYEFFDLIRGKLFAWHLSERGQFVVITLIAFFLSAVLDNLTTTIIMIQIARKFFKGNNMIIAAAGITIAANAGGAFSPIGDITTIMMWFAHKFETLEIIYKGFFPAFIRYAIACGIMSFTIKKETPDSSNELVGKLHKTEYTVIIVTFISFLLPIFVSLIDLPPYLGLLLGLGIVWTLVDAFKRFVPYETHLNASIEEFIKRADIASLKFFTGILLAVSALHSLGVLEKLAAFIYGAAPSVGKIIAGNITLGFLSAILDNVPLTAIAINILDTTNSGLWILLSIAVTTGGSLLIIGSSAGVVAMGMVKELTFSKYLRIAFVPVMLGFAASLGVWAIEFFVLGW